jgi:hypothetical protein
MVKLHVSMLYFENILAEVVNGAGVIQAGAAGD